MSKLLKPHSISESQELAKAAQPISPSRRRLSRVMGATVVAAAVAAAYGYNRRQTISKPSPKKIEVPQWILDSSVEPIDVLFIEEKLENKIQKKASGFYVQNNNEYLDELTLVMKKHINEIIIRNQWNEKYVVTHTGTNLINILKENELRQQVWLERYDHFGCWFSFLLKYAISNRRYLQSSYYNLSTLPQDLIFVNVFYMDPEVIDNAQPSVGIVNVTYSDDYIEKYKAIVRTKYIFKEILCSKKALAAIKNGDALILTKSPESEHEYSQPSK